MTELIWWPERGYGKHELDPEVTLDIYNESYFANFAKISDCARGRALNDARREFVERYFTGDIIDIGVGSGAFMEEWEAGGHEEVGCEAMGSDAVLRNGTARGFDVAVPAINELIKAKKFSDPRAFKAVEGQLLPDLPALTMWDSIEHMKAPSEFLNNWYKWIFISTPIYESAEHCLQSHHYKPGEHIWYFTERGLIGYMLDHGYEMIERSRFEENYGRKDIGSYAFQKTDFSNAS